MNSNGQYIFLNGLNSANTLFLWDFLPELLENVELANKQMWVLAQQSSCSFCKQCYKQHFFVIKAPHQIWVRVITAEEHSNGYVST